MKRKPRRFGPRLTVSVTGDAYEALSVLAAKDDASISWVIRRAINEYLRRHGSGLGPSLRTPAAKPSHFHAHGDREDG